MSDEVTNEEVAEIAASFCDAVGVYAPDDRTDDRNLNYRRAKQWMRDFLSRRVLSAGGAVTVPDLFGCCAHCGKRLDITIGPVNDTVCIGVKPRCICDKGYNLWPANGVSATTAGRAAAPHAQGHSADRAAKANGAAPSDICGCGHRRDNHGPFGACDSCGCVGFAAPSPERTE